jgi:two-component system sensor histidine kinase VicK
VFVSTAPFFSEGIAGVVTVFRDISEEKAIDQSKSQFISIASHQLRTPLTTLKWYTEALLDGDLGKINKEQKKYLEELHRTNDRLLKLVSAFLNASKIELGTFSLEPKLVNIEEIAETVLSELVGKIEQKKVKIIKKYDPSIKSAYADPKLVDIIFQNLFANAIKYSPPKSTVTITLEQKKDTLSMAVEDHGCGIPESQQGKIFTKLFRADNARSIDPDGTGLGLYMTKSIVDASGGKVWFVSKENQGTTFYVLLPSGKTNQKEEGKTVL